MRLFEKAGHCGYAAKVLGPGVKPMRTRLFLFFATSLFAVSGMIVLTSTAYTQAPQAGAGGQGGRGGGQGARGAGAAQQGGQGGGLGRANTPTFSGPPAGMQALPMDMFTS